MKDVIARSFSDEAIHISLFSLNRYPFMDCFALLAMTYMRLFYLILSYVLDKCEEVLGLRCRGND